MMRDTYCVRGDRIFSRFTQYVSRIINAYEDL